jgi:sulfur relay (sulfurtransferase) complex TusBCD TusD component (DsrE family)
VGIDVHRPPPRRRRHRSAPSASGDPIGERLAKVAEDHGILLMMCDQCALIRGLADGEAGAATPLGTVGGVAVGCFPDLYAALAGNPPDHVITL